MQVNSSLFSAKIIINGRPAQEYRDRSGNAFVEGRKGSNFELELKNLTGRRLLIHPSVDGLSVMTGKEASRKDSTQGYVLNPWQVTLIPGWRLDDDNVAKFFFAGAGKSYAEKKGRGKDKGVIACAVWEEQTSWYWYELPPIVIGTIGGVIPGGTGGLIYRGGGTHSGHTINVGSVKQSPLYYDSAFTPESASHGQADNSINYCASCSGEEPTNGGIITGGITTQSLGSAQNLGTGFGAKTAHAVTATTFVPAQIEPNAVAVIYYDDLKGLQARGIKVPERKDTSLPNPFPKDRGCEPPAGWRG